MLANSSQFLCAPGQEYHPYAPPITLSSAPYNVIRRNHHTFLLCDSTPQQGTKVYEYTVSGEQTLLMHLKDTKCQRWDSFDDFVMIVSREGDITYLNLENKCIDIVKKQHPGHAVEVVHTDQEFLTSGGHVKAINGEASERIVKIWGVDNDDKLFCKGRFNTGHTKPIQCTLVLNRTLLATFSKDRKIHISDLIQEATVCSIRTPPTNQQPLAGCQLDHSSLLFGGNRPCLSLVDIRNAKFIRDRIDLKGDELVQLTKIVRFSDNEVILCNVNKLEILDLRQMKVRSSYKVDGETNWALRVLNKEQFVIGNRERFVQVWTKS